MHIFKIKPYNINTFWELKIFDSYIEIIFSKQKSAVEI